MHEKLSKLLKEWDKYKSASEKTPERIISNELWSIGKSVELTLAEMRGTEEYKSITQEERNKLEEIFNFLVAEASTR